MSDGSQSEDIIRILQQGTRRLAKHFPWVAGQVVCEGAAEDNTGVFKIKPLDDAPRLYIKDLRGDPSVASMDDLRQSGFPMSAFDEAIVSPRKTESGVPGGAGAEHEVFQLQANLIRGGLILTFLGQHQCMDGIGQAQVIALLSKACRNEAFTEDELRIGNRAPENVVQLLGPSWEPGPELLHTLVKKDASQPGPGSIQCKIPAEMGVWSQFSFSAAAQKALKALATQTLPPNASYVSTDDALSAFIWQSVARVRLKRFDDPTTKALFARAIDLRRYLGIAETHPGFIQSMTHHEFTMQEVAHGPLGTIASDFRAAVDPATSNLEYHGRSLATLISRIPDKALISFIAGYDLARDFMLSSWSSQNSYGLDFGLGLGTAEAVRRPLFAGYQGMAYMLPRSPEGDVVVIICLGAEETGELRADGEFTKYAQLV